MPVEIRELVGSPENKYPLLRSELREGQYAESDNGSVVFVLRTELGQKNPSNVINGIGGYASSARFRLLTNHEIRLTTDDQGYAGSISSLK